MFYRGTKTKSTLITNGVEIRSINPLVRIEKCLFAELKSQHMTTQSRSLVRKSKDSFFIYLISEKKELIVSLWMLEFQNKLPYTTSFDMEHHLLSIGKIEQGAFEQTTRSNFMLQT